MSKSTVKNAHWQKRTASFSTHGSRTGVNLLGWGEQEKLEPHEKREALVLSKISITKKLQELKAELKEKLPYAAFEEKNKLREELKATLLDVEAEIKKIGRVNRPHLPDMGECIIDILRERMTKPQWQAVIKEAHERFKAANGEAYTGEDYK